MVKKLMKPGSFLLEHSREKEAPIQRFTSFITEKQLSIHKQNTFVTSARLAPYDAREFGKVMDV